VVCTRWVSVACAMATPSCVAVPLQCKGVEKEKCVEQCFANFEPCAIKEIGSVQLGQGVLRREEYFSGSASAMQGLNSYSITGIFVHSPPQLIQDTKGTAGSTA
jgi:hypothetical protein